MRWSRMTAPTDVVYERLLKYRLLSTVECAVPGIPDFHDGKVRASGGRLTIERGFSWDGASGPTFDTPNTMRPSLVHDALYGAIRRGRLLPGCRKRADGLFRSMLKESGMGMFRRGYFYLGVRLFGAKHCRPAA